RMLRPHALCVTSRDPEEREPPLLPPPQPASATNAAAVAAMPRFRRHLDCREPRMRHLLVEVKRLIGAQLFHEPASVATTRAVPRYEAGSPTSADSAAGSYAAATMGSRLKAASSESFSVAART